MILSILICSLNERAGQLARLLRSLGETEGVEILVEMDNREMTTGAKRNKLLTRAQGEWVVFIDDDDKVMTNYIPAILNALKKNPDAVGFKGWMLTDGRNRMEWRISKNYKYEKKGTIYYRYNNHLSPVRREIALQVMFPDQYVGEDFAYAKKMHDLGLVKTEVFINDFLYLYDFKTNKP